MDIFKEYLKKEGNELVTRALTDQSYIAYRQRGIRKNNSDYEQVNKPIKTNFDMATYGDAILKMILMDFLWNKDCSPTIEKSRLESDRILVNVVASNYSFLKYLKFDKGDNDKSGSNHLPQDYDYDSTAESNKNPHKFIATGVEAMIAAIYLDSPKDNFEKLKTLIVNQWIPIIRESETYKKMKSSETDKEKSTEH